MDKLRAFRIAARAIKELPEEVAQGQSTMENIAHDLVTVLQSWGKRLEGHTSSAYILTPKELKLIVELKNRIENLYDDSLAWTVDKRLYNLVDIQHQNKIKQDIVSLNNAIVDVSVEIKEYVEAVDKALNELRRDLAGIDIETSKSIKAPYEASTTFATDDYVKEHFPEVHDDFKKMVNIYNDADEDSDFAPKVTDINKKRVKLIRDHIDSLEKCLKDLDDLWRSAQSNLVDKIKTLKESYKDKDQEEYGDKLRNLRNQYIFLGSEMTKYKERLEFAIGAWKKEVVGYDF